MSDAQVEMDKKTETSNMYVQPKRDPKAANRGRRGGTTFIFDGASRQC